MDKVFTVYSAINGFIIECPSDYGGTSGKPRYYITELPDCSPDSSKELEAVKDILYNLLDLLGYMGSKHDRYRIRIVVEDQHRMEESEI